MTDFVAMRVFFFFREELKMPALGECDEWRGNRFFRINEGLTLVTGVI